MVPKQAFLIFLAFISSSVFGQIQHFTNRNYDLDGEGGSDFIRKDEYSYDPYNHLYERFSQITLRNNAEIAFRENWDDWMLIADYLVFGDSISENLNWTTESIYINHQRFNVTKEYYNDKEYFFAVRIKMENSYHYGWIRFRGGTDGGLRDAAIQLTPDKSILAGEGISSIKTIVDTVIHQQNNNSWSDYMVRFFPPYNEEYI
ncbi:MAG TPA: hypothetical protein VKA38_16465, partial [Draconibacterium sp.]|nr:hypothetical protein [Draconibacterium sp.]